MDLFTDIIDSVDKFRSTSIYADHGSVRLAVRTHLHEELVDDNNFWKAREFIRKRHNGLNQSKKRTYVTFEGVSLAPDHYPIACPDNPLLVSFIPDAEHGKKDRRAVMKPGKYLTKYYDLDNEQVKSLVTTYIFEHSPPQLEYARTEEEIVWVYENGPESCMMGKGWSVENHPCRVYAGPDTAVVFIRTASGKRVCARTVIRTDTTPHQWIRIYGDTERMTTALEAAGLEQAGDGLFGVKLPYLATEDERYVSIPYLDGGYTSFDIGEDQKTVVVGTGPAIAKSTNGRTVSPLAFECECCSQPTMKYERATPVDRQSAYCPRCADSHWVLCYGANNQQDYYANSNNYIEFEGEYYAKKHLAEYGLHQIVATGEVVRLASIEKCAVTGRPLLTGYIPTRLTAKTRANAKAGAFDPADTALSEQFYISLASGKGFAYKPRSTSNVKTLAEVSDLLISRFGFPVANGEAATLFSVPVAPTTLSVLTTYANSAYTQRHTSS